MSIDARRAGMPLEQIPVRPQEQGVPRVSADSQTRSDGSGLRLQVGTGVTNQISWYDGDTLVAFIIVSASPYVMLISGVGATINIAEALTVNSITLAGGLKATQLGVVMVNGANNNFNLGTPPYVNNLVTGPTGAFNITGIANGVDGAIVFIDNGTNQVMTITNNSGASSAGNKILTGTGADVPKNHVILKYDPTNLVWRMY